MKLIPLRTDGKFPTIAILDQAVSVAPNGINPTQMRSRIRILDAIDNAKNDTLLLEDADYSTLVDAVNGMPWAIADRSLLQIIDDVVNAVAPPAPAPDAKG